MINRNLLVLFVPVLFVALMATDSRAQTEEQQSQIEKISKAVNKSGSFYKQKEYAKSAGQIREAVRMMSKLSGSGDDVMASLKKDYARIAKAQELLTAKDQEFDDLPALEDLMSGGSGTKGSDSKGSDSKGSDSKGSDSKGSDSKGSGSKGSDTKGDEKISFVSQVAPIIVEQCGQCHIDQKLGGYSAESYTKLIKKSRKGEVVTAKDIDASRLISLVESGKMPKKKPKLKDDQIQILKDWIEQGARFDGKSRDKKQSLKSYVKMSEGSDKR